MHNCVHRPFLFCGTIFEMRRNEATYHVHCLNVPAPGQSHAARFSDRAAILFSIFLYKAGRAGYRAPVDDGSFKPVWRVE